MNGYSGQAGTIIKNVFSSMGERSLIGSTAQGEDIWDGAADQIPVPPEAGEQMTLVSSSDADNGATATGILTVRIEYLDGTGLQKTEDIILNGLTPVNTVATDISFVNDFYALTQGANGVAVGDVIIYKLGSASTIYNLISVGGNKSLVINRKVPSDKVLYITGWAVSEIKDKETSFRLRANCAPDGNEVVGGFLFKRNLLSKKTSFYEEIKPPIKICSGAMVKISAWADLGNGAGSASFNGYLS